MGITVLIVAALATWEILEIWRHSSIMASWRARTENWEGFLGDLLACPFCLAPWTALACLVALSLPDWCGWLGWIPSTVIHAFAVARLANLGNDLGYPVCRTPRHDQTIPSPLDADEAAETSSNPLSGDDGSERHPDDSTEEDRSAV